MTIWTLLAFALVLRHHDGFWTVFKLNSKPNTFKKSAHGILPSSQGSAVFTASRKSGIFPPSKSDSKVNSRKLNTTSGELSSLLPENEKNVDSTRGALVRIIEDSWSRVSHLIPESTLALCQEVIFKISRTVHSSFRFEYDILTHLIANCTRS